MDIYAKPGTEIIFNHPSNGYDHDQEEAKNHLILGSVYTVERTVVHSWHTDVYLKEVPGISFNSVLFDDYEPKEAEK